jgi:hypothetical protein
MTWVLGHPRRADAKVDIKNYHGPTTTRENVIRKYLSFPILLFFKCDYGLNSCRCSNPELPKCATSLFHIFLIRHTFFTPIFFRGIKLMIFLSTSAELHIQKVILADI